MVRKTFSENNGEKALFANSTERAINTAASASQTLNLDSDSAESYKSSLLQDGKLRRFGAGSLLTYSHLETGPPIDGVRQWKPSLLEKFPNINTKKIYKTVNAALEGYENDFVCHDIHYRGTKENKGITIGIDEVSGGITHGGILETNLFELGLNENEILEFIKYDAEQFVDREFPPNMPIYTFKIKDLKLESGEIVPGLVCVADKNGPLYAGNLDFSKRAAILASAMGPTVNPKTGEAKGKGMVTDIDYMRTTIDSMIKKNVPVPERFMTLYEAAIELRKDLDPATLTELQSHEIDNAHEGILEFLYEEKTQETPSQASWNLGQSSSLDLHHDA